MDSYLVLFVISHTNGSFSPLCWLRHVLHEFSQELKHGLFHARWWWSGMNIGGSIRILCVEGMQLVGQPGSHVNGTFGIQFPRLKGSTNGTEASPQRGRRFVSECGMFDLSGTQDNGIHVQNSIRLGGLVLWVGNGNVQSALLVNFVVGGTGNHFHGPRLFQGGSMNPSRRFPQSLAQFGRFPLQQVQLSLWLRRRGGRLVVLVLVVVGGRNQSSSRLQTGINSPRLPKGLWIHIGRCRDCRIMIRCRMMQQVFGDIKANAAGSNEGDTLTDRYVMFQDINVRDDIGRLVLSGNVWIAWFHARGINPHVDRHVSVHLGRRQVRIQSYLNRSGTIVRVVRVVVIIGRRRCRRRGLVQECLKVTEGFGKFLLAGNLLGHLKLSTNPTVLVVDDHVMAQFMGIIVSQT